MRKLCGLIQYQLLSILLGTICSIISFVLVHILLPTIFEDPRSAVIRALVETHEFDSRIDKDLLMRHVFMQGLGVSGTFNVSELHITRENKIGIRAIYVIL